MCVCQQLFDVDEEMWQILQLQYIMTLLSLYVKTMASFTQALVIIMVVLSYNVISLSCWINNKLRIVT